MIRRFSIAFVALTVALVGISSPSFADQRIASGPGGTLRFEAGSEIQAGFIELDTGEQYENCYYNRTPVGGYLKDGVINPWPQEAAAMQYNCTIERQINAAPAVSSQPVATVARPPAPQPTQSPIVQPAPTTFRYIYRDPNDPTDHGTWVVKITQTDGSVLFIEDGPAQWRVTGQGRWGRFVAGERVWAFNIKLDTGQFYQNCWLDTYADGAALDGVINPPWGEIAHVPPCGEPVPERVATGNNIVLFPAGAAVAGDITLDNGTQHFACYLPSAPMGGRVTKGVLWPDPAEVANLRRCA